MITKEAFAIYLKHLAPDGILAVNISNRHLNLVPVLWNISKYYNLTMAVIPNEADGRLGFPSSWVLMAQTPALLESPTIAERSILTDQYTTKVPLWTDDFSNLFQILK